MSSISCRGSISKNTLQSTQTGAETNPSSSLWLRIGFVSCVALLSVSICMAVIGHLRIEQSQIQFSEQTLGQPIDPPPSSQYPPYAYYTPSSGAIHTHSQWIWVKAFDWKPVSVLSSSTSFVMIQNIGFGGIGLFCGLSALFAYLKRSDEDKNKTTILAASIGLLVLGVGLIASGLQLTSQIQNFMDQQSVYKDWLRINENEAWGEWTENNNSMGDYLQGGVTDPLKHASIIKWVGMGCLSVSLVTLVAQAAMHLWKKHRLQEFINERISIRYEHMI